MDMINFLNEKTVYSGASIADFNRVRTILETGNIPYKYKTVDLAHNSYKGQGGVTRSAGGNFARADASIIYEVLVNKKDYDNALYLIGRR